MEWVPIKKKDIYNIKIQKIVDTNAGMIYNKYYNGNQPKQIILFYKVHLQDH